ncbi:MAG: hypothetical protein K2O09_04350, partial [Treponemataceae bacterium]|nr:hypothetical protein [Treponemataceae bacterium]
MPFEENMSGQATAFRRLKKMRRGKQRRFAVRRKHVWAGNKFLFVAHFCIGERKNFYLLLAFALGNEKIFVRCSLLRWGAKKFLFVACFCVGEAQPVWGLVKIPAGRQQP